MTPRLAPLALSLLLACNSDKDDGGGDQTRDEYLVAFCRVYSDPDCVATIEAECDPLDLGPFAAQQDCETNVSFFIDACDAAGRWLSDNADLVDECVAQLDAVECGTDSICDEEGQPLTEDGPCGQVDSQLRALCSTDSGF